MLKVISAIIAISTLLFKDCDIVRLTNDVTNFDADIYYNNRLLSISTNDSQRLLVLVEGLLSEADGLYELLVTDDLITSIRQNENYLEIIYKKERNISIGKFESISFTKLLIPLTGKYTSLNHLTFFCGYPEYSSGPYTKSKGLIELRTFLGKHLKE